MEATIALAGNPNCGKTTLFNALTGARQHVGNYPGVTVEKKTGRYTLEGHQLHLVDLPGTYSLTAYSLEEVVARDFIVKERPALVVNIVDATNLERNLYLTLQFMEMGVPVCMALNMMDTAAAKGIEIDVDQLSKLLGVPVIPTVARRGEGREALMRAALEAVQHNRSHGRRALKITYGPDIDPVLEQMAARIAERRFLTADHRPEWVALKFLENDEQMRSIGSEADPAFVAELDAMMAPLVRHLEQTLETYPEAVIADYRYGYIRSLVQATREDDSISLGASPRAGLMLLLGAKSLARFEERDFVTPDDVKTAFLPALRHRIVLSPEAELEGAIKDQVLRAILDRVEVPR